MTKFETGGSKGKGVVDNVFIMRALISYMSLVICKSTFVSDIL